VETALPLTEHERIIWVGWDYEIGRVYHLCGVCRDVLDAQADLGNALSLTDKGTPAVAAVGVQPPAGQGALRVSQV